MTNMRRDEPVRIFWRVPKSSWCVEPVTAAKLQALVSLWEMNYVDFVAVRVSKDVKPLPSNSTITAKVNEEECKDAERFDESMTLSSRMDTPIEQVTEFPRQRIPRWWVQGPNSQFITITCNAKQYNLVQRKFSRQYETADWVSRSGSRVYYENAELPELLFGK